MSWGGGGGAAGAPSAGARWGEGLAGGPREGLNTLEGTSISGTEGLRLQFREREWGVCALAWGRVSSFELAYAQVRGQPRNWGSWAQGWTRCSEDDSLPVQGIALGGVVWVRGEQGGIWGTP